MCEDYQDDTLCEHSYYDKSNCPYCRIKKLEEALKKIKERAFKRKYKYRNHFCEAQYDVQSMYDIATEALEDKP